MTRSLFLSVLTIGAALSLTAGVALAGSDTVPAAQILNALKPKSATRGLSAGTQVDPAASAKEGELPQHRPQPAEPLAVNGRTPGDRRYRRQQAEDRSGDSLRLQLG